VDDTYGEFRCKGVHTGCREVWVFDTGSADACSTPRARMRIHLVIYTGRQCRGLWELLEHHPERDERLVAPW